MVDPVPGSCVKHTGAGAVRGMARKSGWFSATYKYMFELAAVVCLCSALVALQRRCMNVGAGDFVTGYCLSNSHMRALLAAILTVVGLIITSMVTSAVEAYRSAKLASGINEGVYIAMASQSVKYRCRALLTAWGPAMMLIILCTNAPNAIQTLANLGIKTAGVYVQNLSTAVIYDAYSYYNASVSLTDFSSLAVSAGVLTKMRDYKSRAISNAVDHGDGVATIVLRDAYMGPLFISYPDATNAFKRLETILTITSTCTSALLMGPLSSVPVSPSAVNLTAFMPSRNIAGAIIYDVQYEITSDNSLLLHSSLSSPFCASGDCTTLRPNTSVLGFTSTCTSTLVVQDQDIIFTVDTEVVTPVRLVSNATTVSISDLANLVVGYAASIETTSEGVDNNVYFGLVSAVYASFPDGSFDKSFSSILHTKLCASGSLALEHLFVNYGIDDSDSELLDAGTVGNAYVNFTVPVPLYHMVQLTYISTADIAVMTGVITGFACLVSAVGMAFALQSRINVKPATDSSLSYNSDPALIATKQALMRGLSNDPHGQMAFEFRADSVLYCRESAVNKPDCADAPQFGTPCRVNISYSNSGSVPNHFRHYY